MAIILAIIVGVFVGIASCQDSKATNDDIKMSVNEQSLTSYRLIITAKEDIEDLELKITFYDEQNVVIKNFIRKLGDVEKNQKYDVSFPLTEFTLDQNLTNSRVEVNVTGGKIIKS